MERSSGQSTREDWKENQQPHLTYKKHAGMKNLTGESMSFRGSGVKTSCKLRGRVFCMDMGRWAAKDTVRCAGSISPSWGGFCSSVLSRALKL